MSQVLSNEHTTPLRPIERYGGAGVDRAESASEAPWAAVALKGQLPTLGRLNNDGSHILAETVAVILTV